ncbi:ANTAR domain-containing protein [Octadecabacter sp. G9-8]|uniref:ANTAR domain-containing protein n=1 Tax=Octadecabacter dasysiphoniae TaxID=2909341 RepID=A0ABS9CXN5_9RHOB|nr:ANTAR domain-containing protein [Octadecabacter dasysiphoniae]MCF2871992.1 ANTAR domain-containing protein [Octadecabacter dasysiphoniae]
MQDERDDKLLRRLRQTRVLVIHPDDEDRKTLNDHLRRIGCQTSTIWPVPTSVPDDVDVVMFLLNRLDDAKDLTWMASSDTITRIAIVAYETPEILAELERLHVHGVLSKPVRVFGVLSALTTSIGVARHEGRLKQRIKSLDETLKARRQIEKAVAILSQTKNITEADAYKRLRDKSMSSKIAIADLAEAIISSNDI